MSTEGYEPTIKDVIGLLKGMATQNSMTELSTQIRDYQNKTEQKIEQIKDDIKEVTSTSTKNSDRIALLEEQIEAMNQDKLRNNIRISGIPDSVNDLPNTIFNKICRKLEVNIDTLHINAYKTKGGAFVIVNLLNQSNKLKLLKKMKEKKSLMVEEVFEGIKSNSQIYINDHLTHYNNNLFQTAFRAKKEGKLSFVSSTGGKIRVKKEADGQTVFITNQRMLNDIIDAPMPETKASNNDAQRKQTKVTGNGKRRAPSVAKHDAKRRT